MSKTSRRVLTVIMDGVGASENTFGNAVANALKPNLLWLQKYATYRTVLAHGKSVGLPTDNDIGNSEVGHNALGAGRIFDQGAKLVQESIDTGAMFRGHCWNQIIEQVKRKNSTLHFIGLLSDGNVHSHENHLYAMLRQAKQSQVKKVRIHVLFDGRDVGEKSAEIYIGRLISVLSLLKSADFDVEVASGGGRMQITMDRYNADWDMVERGWKTHVLGEAPHKFPDLTTALHEFRNDKTLTDQYIPAFVITKDERPVGTIQDDDAVIFFNFRGDRAMELSLAFTDPKFNKFDRQRVPNVFYAGMMEYDGDLQIPPNYLVSPPAFDDTLGEHLVKLGLRQFACSETQKFGHVTYFWNGNRTGYFDKNLEEYVEVPSDKITFDLKPWMKAYEITEETLKRMHLGSFDFGRINYANGDMVGHTGNYEAAVIAVETVDLMIGRLIQAARATNTILIVTADHGNADEMFDAKAKDFPDWQNLSHECWPSPKTAHTINPVPFAIFDPERKHPWKLNAAVEKGSLGNLANTVLMLMGLETRDIYLPSLVVKD